MTNDASFCDSAYPYQRTLRTVCMEFKVLDGRMCMEGCDPAMGTRPIMVGTGKARKIEDCTGVSRRWSSSLSPSS